MVLNSILGGAAQYFRGKPDEIIPELYEAFQPALPQNARAEEIALRSAMGTLDDLRPEASRMEIVSGGGSANAAFNEALDPGTLAGGRFTPKVLARLGAGTRVVHLGVTKAARRASQMLDDAGLTMQGNKDFIPTAIGGTVRNRITTWHGPLAKSLQTLDDLYVKYKLGDQAKGLTTIRAMVPREGKMSRKEFNEQISLAMNYGDEHEIAEVAEAAKTFRREVLEPMAKAAQQVDLLPEKLDVKGATSYLMRLYDSQAIGNDPQGFVNLLTRHFNAKLEARVADANVRAKEERESALQRADDLEASPEDAARFVEELEQELAYLDEYHPGADLDRDLKQFANEKRRQSRAGEDTSDTQGSKEAFIERRKETSPEEFDLMKDYRMQRRRIRSRLKNLRENRFALREKQAELLRKADRAEEQNLQALERLITKAKSIQAKLDKVSDEVLDAELAKLQKQIEAVARRMEKADERVTRLRADAAEALADGADDAGARAKIAETWEMNERRADRYNRLADRVEAAENMDRAGVRATIELVLDDAVTSTQRIMAGRAVRQQKMLDRAAEIDPEAAIREAASLRELAAKATQRQRRRLQAGERAILPGDLAVRGEDLHLAKTETALKLAESFRDWVMGTPIRTPGFDVLQAERGAALARMLDIDYRVLQPYLKTDVEAILKAYVRTMAPDIEIKRVFPDPGLQSVVGQGGTMDKELNQQLRALQAQTLTDEARAKESKRLQDRNEQDKLDLAAMVQRLRHTRGIPDDPTHMFYRIGRTMKDVNVFTLMGSVVPSSIADIARPVTKYGLLNTMRHGWMPWITHLRSMRRIGKQEIASTGGIADIVLHSRFLAMMDIMDDVGRRNLLERGAQALTQKTGIVAMFDYWNVGHKQMVAGIANAELWKQLDILGQEVVGPRKLRDAQEFLASHGIDEALANEFLRMRAEGRGEYIAGTFWPNTAEWGTENAATFRAFLNKAMQDTIVTPGAPDRPRWVDKNIGLSMLAQFRSFTFSSTFKVVLAGMQDAKARTLVGFMFSMGLGALSYWVYGHTAGGKARERMLNATDEEWVWEAMMRSGMLGVIAEPMMLTEAASQQYQPETRMLSQVLGPSVGLGLAAGGLVSDAYNLEADNQTVRNARRFVPYQNVFWLRQVFNEAEQAMKDALK